MDTDGDGWTDLREERAGTNALDPDTDGDGIWDDKDDNPLDRNIPMVTHSPEASVVESHAPAYSEEVKEVAAAETELINIQSAVVAMMVDQGISTTTLSSNITDHDTSGEATNNMAAFPDSSNDGINLFNYGTGTGVSYVAIQNTKGTYYIDSSGTVYQATTGYD